MTRRSPIRHKVRDHKRSGFHVNHYIRGEGKALQEPERVIGSIGTEGNYRVTITYGEPEAFTGKGAYPKSYGAISEHYIVQAGDYPEAMNEGINMSGRPDTPMSIRMSRR